MWLVIFNGLELSFYEIWHFKIVKCYWVFFLISDHFVSFYKSFPISSLSSLDKNFPINCSKQLGLCIDYPTSLTAGRDWNRQNCHLLLSSGPTNVTCSCTKNSRIRNALYIRNFCQVEEDFTVALVTWPNHKFTPTLTLVPQSSKISSLLNP